MTVAFLFMLISFLQKKIDREKNQISSILPTKIDNPSTDSLTSHSAPSIDLLPNKRHARHIVRTSIMVFGIFIVLAVIGFSAYGYSITKNKITEKNNQIGFFGQIRRIIHDDTTKLTGASDDRINVLLLGQGGEDHPGGTLTDTIMVASIQPSTKKIALLSIPRDLVVAIDQNPKNKITTDIAYLKINSAMIHGGIELAMQKVTEVTGLPIHYYVVIDFGGFRQLIDDVGGVNVTIEKSFVDREYPDYHYGYQTIRFTEGEQHLTGEQALQFTRSRHGNNGEGSDFARARRQQIILEAFRHEVLSASTILNPARLTTMFNDLGDHIGTNMELWEMTTMAQMLGDVLHENIRNIVLDDSQDNLLTSEIAAETGAYILMPRAGIKNYNAIHKLAASAFHDSPSSENVIVSIQNGTTTNGLGATIAAQLPSTMEIGSPTNAVRRDVATTIIFDISKGKYPQARQTLQKIFHSEVRDATRPAVGQSVYLGTDLDPNVIDVASLPPHVDFIIILGNDAKSLFSKNTKHINTNATIE